MKEKHIQQINTAKGELHLAILGFVVSLLFIVMPISILTGDNVAIGTINVVVAALVALGILAWRQYHAKKLLQQRTKHIYELAIARGWGYFELEAVEARAAVNGSALYDLAERGSALRNYVKSPEWEYADLEYPVYQKDKYGEYKAATIYYGVLSAQLPRKLPNVFFDSKSHRKTQFKKIFDDKQRHRLEGDFNNYFETYFPETYTIDSLSFITPDVMEALIGAKNYDIEIVGDRVMIYGPMNTNVQAQLEDMSQKLAVIKKQLLDNILTYRDERLPYEQGRQTVDVTGMSLKRKRENIWAAVIFIAIYIIIEIMEALN